MAHYETAVLDIGSSKISVMIAEKGINNTFNIKSSAEENYDGFSNGEFFSVESLKDAIVTSIKKAGENLRYKIKKIYISVPGEFSYCVNKEVNVTFPKRKKVKDSDIFEIFDSSQNFPENSFVINRSPIYFILDDNRKVQNPVGEVTSKLNILISYILTDKSFIDLISKILNEINIYEIDFISSSLAEALYLTEPEMRDNGLILIDCGYITTSVSLIKGDGLIALKAFSMGGGHITGDLCQCLKLSFTQAENLKKKVVLSLDATDDDFYEVTVNDKVQPVSCKLVNEIILARLDMFCEVFNKIFNSSEFNLQNKPFVPILITGGGINYLKGAKDYFGKQLGKNIDYIAPSVPQMNRPHYSSILSLLDISLKQEKSIKKNLFQKLFNK
ncbi:MAG: cell division FtsA domain-containing protein [Christensenellales bacterium]